VTLAGKVGRRLSAATAEIEDDAAPTQQGQKLIRLCAGNRLKVAFKPSDELDV
jgi:hypothetical protein